MDVVLRYFDYSFITNEYINWLNNPELTKYSEQRHLKHTFESCKEYCEAFHNSTNFLFAIIDSESNEHVGNINAYIDIYNGTADMGILVGKGNKGYGYIAWIKMIPENEQNDIKSGSETTLETPQTEKHELEINSRILGRPGRPKWSPKGSPKS